MALNSDDLQDVISRSSVVIARSGYSTLMDLFALGKKAVVVPTPGQTEQEYLAKRMHERRIFQTMSQEDFNLKKAMTTSKNFTGFNNTQESSFQLLENELERLFTATSLSPLFLK
jgi:predicted glycosyltransferase